MDEQSDALKRLTEREQECVRRYVALLRERLGDNLLQVWLFGSAARGDMWSDSFPIRSDIDILVLTREPLTVEAQEELLNETYPLYLECGRQIGPQWRTVEQFTTSEEGSAGEFKARVEEEGVILYERAM